MIKAHVQIPDNLYHSARKVAERKEWSFAEIVRRGLEYMTETNRARVQEKTWELPIVKGTKAINISQINDAISEMRETKSIATKKN